MEQLTIDLNQPQAVPQKGIVNLLETIPDAVCAKVDRIKKVVVDKEGSGLFGLNYCFKREQELVPDDVASAAG